MIGRAGSSNFSRLGRGYLGSINDSVLRETSIIVMEGEIFLHHYRISSGAHGSRVELGRNGPAITYRGSDLQSGAPVALTLLPIASVDPDERERFEEKARAATQLDHINIAKTVAFGTAGN